MGRKNMYTQIIRTERVDLDFWITLDSAGRVGAGRFHRLFPKELEPKRIEVVQIAAGCEHIALLRVDGIVEVLLPQWSENHREMAVQFTVMALPVDRGAQGLTCTQLPVGLMLQAKLAGRAARPCGFLALTAPVCLRASKHSPPDSAALLSSSPPSLRPHFSRCYIILLLPERDPEVTCLCFPIHLFTPFPLRPCAPMLPLPQVNCCIWGFMMGREVRERCAAFKLH